jgi:rubredoxin
VTDCQTIVIAPKFDWRVSMKKWQCVVCGFIYDEAEGWPEDGIEPGTRWDDVPEDWVCPDCGVGKEDFEMIEID